MTTPAKTPPRLLAQIRSDADLFGRERLATEACVSVWSCDRALTGATVRPATLACLLAAGERLRTTSTAAPTEAA